MPGGIRTPDLLVRSQTLYPAELQAHLSSLLYTFQLISYIINLLLQEKNTKTAFCQYLIYNLVNKKSTLMKKVSIILPTFNGERFIKESIESILNQSYPNWELIIVDDGSADNTPNIIRNYALKDSRITVLSNEINKNLPASLNLGFENAKGDYYTWTSDDNIYKKNAIEIMVDYLNNNPNTDLVSFNEDIVLENGEFEQTLNDLCPNRNILQLTKCCNIGACFMYRKETAQKVGKYDEDMFCAEDYDYWCRIALKGNIQYCNDNLYIYRKHQKSLSATQVPEICKKIDEIRQQYSLAIMRKLKLSKWAQVRLLLEYYNETKDMEWIKTAKNVSKIFFFLYKINNSFK